MSKVQKIEAELEKLSPAEMLEVRDWLDDFLEDQMQFTDEFEGKVQQAERDMAAGKTSRTRSSGPRQ